MNKKGVVLFFCYFLLLCCLVSFYALGLLNVFLFILHVAENKSDSNRITDNHPLSYFETSKFFVNVLSSAAEEGKVDNTKTVVANSNPLRLEKDDNDDNISDDDNEDDDDWGTCWGIRPRYTSTSHCIISFIHFHWNFRIYGYNEWSLFEILISEHQHCLTFYKTIRKQCSDNHPVEKSITRAFGFELSRCLVRHLYNISDCPNTIADEPFNTCIKNWPLEFKFIYMEFHFKMKHACCAMYLYNMPYYEWMKSLFAAQLRAVLKPAIKTNTKEMCRAITAASPIAGGVLSQFTTIEYDYTLFKNVQPYFWMLIVSLIAFESILGYRYYNTYLNLALLGTIEEFIHYFRRSLNSSTEVFIVVVARYHFITRIFLNNFSLIAFTTQALASICQSIYFFIRHTVHLVCNALNPLNRDGDNCRVVVNEIEDVSESTDALADAPKPGAAVLDAAITAITKGGLAVKERMHELNLMYQKLDKEYREKMRRRNTEINHQLVPLYLQQQLEAEGDDVQINNHKYILVINHS